VIGRMFYRTATVSTYIAGFLLFLAGYFGNQHLAQSKHRSLTLAARKDALRSRDREGVGAFFGSGYAGLGSR
jgi:hypothetical protein